MKNQGIKLLAMVVFLDLINEGTIRQRIDIFYHNFHKSYLMYDFQKNIFIFFTARSIPQPMGKDLGTCLKIFRITFLTASSVVYRGLRNDFDTSCCCSCSCLSGTFVKRFGNDISKSLGNSFSKSWK